MVPDDSSAARMPRPGATMASATLLSSARFIAFSVVFEIRVEFSANSRCWQRGDDQKCRPSFCPQHLYPWQGFALQPFEEGAAGGRYIGKPLGNTGAGERPDRIPATGDRYKLSGGREFRGGFGDLDRAGVKRLELEGSERPVPDQCLHPGQHGADMLDAAPAEIQDPPRRAHPPRRTT